MSPGREMTILTVLKDTVTLKSAVWVRTCSDRPTSPVVKHTTPMPPHVFFFHSKFGRLARRTLVQPHGILRRGLLLCLHGRRRLASLRRDMCKLFRLSLPRRVRTVRRHVNPLFRRYIHSIYTYVSSRVPM